MKIIYILGISYVMPLLATSQEVAAYTEKGVAVIEHVVAKGQGVQAIAARYKANYSELLKLNNLSSPALLKEGEKIKVPVAKIIQASCAGPDCVKVYHTVRQSEGLYRIGVNYGNIKAAQLKALNNLSAETVSLGQKILVGYLPLPASTFKTVDMDVPAVAVKNAEESRLEVPKVDAAQATPPVVVKMKDTPVAPAPATAPASVPVPTPVPVATVAGQQPLQAGTAAVPAGKSKGFFAAQFGKGTAELSGKAASFKSESGWTDSKFYILLNEVPPGTVVMVATSANTSNYIYAKVLGALPQVKENNNIKFRLNDAGTSVLGVGQQDTFQATIVY